MKSQYKSIFSGGTLLVTGGTGSFGNAIAKRLLKTDIKEIRIFSRDEEKQNNMRRLYRSEKMKFYIGDVRNYNSVLDALRGVDFVFHAAALKQVPSCEFYPMEAFKTNVLGAENVVQASINSAVKNLVCLSTDKAVYPVNAMGISKAMMEKIVAAKSRSAPDNITISVTRYGNVMASRGSVIPLFIDQIDKGHPISLTDPDMTRFMMTLDDAVELVLFAFENANCGDVFVKKAPAAKISVLAQALTELMNLNNYPMKIIGTRHGEKLHEVLCSREEMVVAKNTSDYFQIPSDNRDLDYDKFFDSGSTKITSADDYNSQNSSQLDIAGMKKLLLKLDIIKSRILKSDDDH